jgi:site-specific recombinase XerC
MVKDDLLAARVMIDRQKMPIKAARDRALLLVGFASAMRRSELVAVRVEHLAYLVNGVEIFLPSSKTDQEAQGRTVFIRVGDERKPIAAVNTIGVAAMFNTRRINSVVRQVMLQKFQANFDRELRVVLQGWAR